MTDETHGGKRAGAGRKPVLEPDARTYTFNLEQRHIDKVRARAAELGMSISATMRQIIDLLPGGPG
jgi:hypothetical protein